PAVHLASKQHGTGVLGGGAYRDSVLEPLNQLWALHRVIGRAVTELAIFIVPPAHDLACPGHRAGVERAGTQLSDIFQIRDRHRHPALVDTVVTNLVLVVGSPAGDRSGASPGTHMAITHRHRGRIK